MQSLHDLATETSEYLVTLPSGRTASIASLAVLFPSSDPDRLPAGALKKSYTSKPLVLMDDEAMFGELAIVRCLAKDNWDAFWADTFHGRRFWRDMPTTSDPVDPPLLIRELYTAIAHRKQGLAGCFDVVAQRGTRIIWLEYKGPDDRPNRNELCWIEAALGAGVAESDLFFVGAAARTRARPSAT